MYLGIIGTGFGKRHAEIYASFPEVEVVGIVGRDEQRTEQAARALGITGYTDINALLTHPAVDAIDVCSPTHAHAEHVIAALEHGKHVFCETPAAYSLAEAEQMSQRAASSGQLLLVALYGRFVSEYKYIHDVVAAGHLGKPKVVFANRRTPAIWGTWDENFILNLMLHDIDYVYWLLGKPISVTSQAHKDASGQCQHVFAALEYEHCSTLVEGCGMMPTSFPFSTSLRVVCEDGALDMNWRWGGSAPISEVIRYPSDGEPETLTIPGYDPYEAECRYFVDCIQGKADPGLLGIDSAIGSLGVALAAKQSVRENGKRISL
jgi:UDP-N-acetylglucosamine 3-dehydrogenase